MSKHSVIFDEPQTWHYADVHRVEIRPIEDIVRQTRTRAIGLVNGGECVYYRYEIFPTYAEAAEALMDAKRRQAEAIRGRIADSQAELREAEEGCRKAATILAGAGV